ncbi:hypothetical protein BD311DRAFT_751708 [Dichomitus squalens]|uniref:Uncharacterized protein n=1 Tax=Dichomitus squalens TaxID=114155 RepID=A0A4Q9MZP8_9APHY|nr:hypothetical protein BD311DRAFT_751708 [Dichomitus squalens]
MYRHLDTVSEAGLTRLRSAQAETAILSVLPTEENGRTQGAVDLPPARPALCTPPLTQLQHEPMREHKTQSPARPPMHPDPTPLNAASPASDDNIPQGIWDRIPQFTETESEDAAVPR